MAVDEKMVVLADEVYQANIWKKGASFSSFKKVRRAEIKYVLSFLLAVIARPLRHQRPKPYCSLEVGNISYTPGLRDVRNVRSLAFMFYTCCRPRGETRTYRPMSFC